MVGSLFVRAVRMNTSALQTFGRSFTGKAVKSKPTIIQRNNARFNAHYEGKPRRPVNFFLWTLLAYCFLVPIAAWEGKTIESAGTQDGYSYGPSTIEQ